MIGARETYEPGDMLCNGTAAADALAGAGDVALLDQRFEIEQMGNAEGSTHQCEEMSGLYAAAAFQDFQHVEDSLLLSHATTPNLVRGPSMVRGSPFVQRKLSRLVCNTNSARLDCGCRSAA